MNLDPTIQSWYQDPEFAALPKPDRDAIISNYFKEQTSQDPEFMQLPIQDQQSTEKSFVDANSFAEERGLLGDIGSHLARGGVSALEGIAGAMRMSDWDPTQETNKVARVGDVLQDKINIWRKRTELLKPDISEATGKEGFLKRGITGAAESIPASLIPLAAGKIGGSLGGAVAGPPGTVLGATVGGAGALFATFGLGEYQRSYDEAFAELKSQGLDDESATQKAKDHALVSATAEAGGEAVGDIASLAFFGLLGKRVVGQPVKQTIKELLGDGGKQFAKAVAKSAPFEAGSEMATAYVQAASAKKTGISDIEPGEAVAEAVIPSVLLSVVFGMGVHGMNTSRARRIYNDLNSEDVNRRRMAVDQISARLDKDAAQKWERAASQLIQSGEKIEISKPITDFTIQKMDQENPVDNKQKILNAIEDQLFDGSATIDDVRKASEQIKSEFGINPEDLEGVIKLYEEAQQLTPPDIETVESIQEPGAPNIETVKNIVFPQMENAETFDEKLRIAQEQVDKESTPGQTVQQKNQNIINKIMPRNRIAEGMQQRQNDIEKLSQSVEQKPVKQSPLAILKANKKRQQEIDRTNIEAENEAAQNRFNKLQDFYDLAHEAGRRGDPMPKLASPLVGELTQAEQNELIDSYESGKKVSESTPTVSPATPPQVAGTQVESGPSPAPPLQKNAITEGQKRAKIGGEFGANGEWYEGGKFIATKDRPKQKKRWKKPTGRQNVEPNKWAPPPETADNIIAAALYPQLGGIEIKNPDGTFSLNKKLSGEYSDSDVIKTRESNINAWNNGARWRLVEVDENGKRTPISDYMGESGEKIEPGITERRQKPIDMGGAPQDKLIQAPKTVNGAELPERRRGDKPELSKYEQGLKPSQLNSVLKIPIEKRLPIQEEAAKHNAKLIGYENGKYFLHDNETGSSGSPIDSVDQIAGKIKENRDAFKALKDIIKNQKGTSNVLTDVVNVFAKKQTETPEFKKWFGESKVVDENGRPLVVYHGSDKIFDMFDPNMSKSENQKFYFTDNSWVAARYHGRGRTEYLNVSDEKELSQRMQDGTLVKGVPGSNIYPVYLSLKNPKIIDYKGEFKSRDFKRELYQSAGHDGLIIRNIKDANFYTENWPTSDIYIAFEPTQIKSAIGNTGAFDPNNPSITGSSQLITDIAAHGAKLIRDGIETFGKFRSAMRERFSAVWDKIKEHIRSIWNVLNNERGQVDVYHGSPYQFDKFSTEKVGTGEGAQAFGAGLYFTSEQDIAKHYADSLSKDRIGEASIAGVVPASPDKGLSNDVWVATKDLSKTLVPNAKTLKSFRELDVVSNGGVLSMVRTILHNSKVLDSVIRLIPIDVVNMLSSEKLTRKMLLDNPSMLIDLLPINSNDLVPGSVEAMDILAPVAAISAAKVHTGLSRFDISTSELNSAMGTNHDYLQLLRKIPQPNEFVNKKGYVYKATLHEGKSPSEYTWLDWDKRVNDNDINKIRRAIGDGRTGEIIYSISGYDENGLPRFNSDSSREVFEFMQKTSGNGLPNIKGQDIYRMLSRKLHSDKNASLFLQRAGIDGIRYPAGTLSGSGGGTNYVVFDENAVTIKEINGKLLDSLKNEKGSSELVNDIVSYSSGLVNDGIKSFGEFRAKLYNRFKNIWDKIKTHIRDLWNILNNQKGEINIDLTGKQEQAPKQAEPEKQTKDELTKEIDDSNDLTGDKIVYDSITPESKKVMDRLRSLYTNKGVISPKKTERLISRYETITKELKEARGDIYKKQAALEKHIKKHLSPADRYRVMHTIKQMASVQTEKAREKKFNEALEKVEQTHQRIERKNLLEKINNLLSKKLPVVTRQGVQGSRYVTSETHVLLKTIRTASKMTKSEGMTELSLMFQSLDRESREASDEELSKIQAINIFSGLQERPINELETALEILEQIIKKGRLDFKAEIEKRRAHSKELSETAVEEFTGGNGLKTTEEEKTEKAKRERKFLGMWKRIKEGIRSYDDMHMSFEFLLDKLSRYDKGSKTLGGKTTEYFASMVHAATNQERAGTSENQNLFHDKLIELYGKRGLAKKLYKNSKTKTKTGVYRYYKAGKKVQMPLSQNEAYKLWQMFQQPSIQPEMEAHGYTSKTMDELEKYIKPEVLEWAKWQINDFYPKYREGVNYIYKKLFFIDMPEVEGYSPISRRYEGQTIDEALLGEGSFLSSVLPGGIKSRVKNMRDFNIIDGDSVLMKHVVEMEHFKAWGLPMHEMRSVLGRETVQTAIKQYHGSTANSVLKKFLNDFAAGGIDRTNTLNALDKLRSNFTKAAIGLNPVVFFKQLASIPAYAMDIPTASFASGIGSFFANPIKAYRTLMKSKMMKARYDVGFERDIMLALQRSTAKSISGKSTLSDALMITTKLGDKAAIIAGGWSVYKYHYTKAKRKGVSDAIAHKRGIEMFERATKRSQQAGDVQDLSDIQRRGSLARLFTMFMTAPMSYYRNMSAGFRNLREGRGSAPENLKRMAITQFVLPAFFQWIASGVPLGDWDDEDTREMIRAMIVGPLNGLFIARYAIEGMLTAAIEGKAYWGGGTSPALSTIELTSNAGVRIHKAVEDGWSDDSLWKVLGDASNIAGNVSGVPVKTIKRTVKGIQEKSVKKAIGWKK